jgi:hypothetical protein
MGNTHNDDNQEYNNYYCKGVHHIQTRRVIIIRIDFLFLFLDFDFWMFAHVDY